MLGKLGLLHMSDKELELSCRMMAESANFFGVGAELILSDGTKSDVMVIIEDNPTSVLLKHVGYNHRDEDADPVVCYTSVSDKVKYIDCESITFNFRNEIKTFRVDKVKATIHTRTFLTMALVPYSKPRENRNIDTSSETFGSSDKIRSEYVKPNGYKRKF